MPKAMIQNLLLSLIGLLALFSVAQAKTIRVGPGQQIKHIADAAEIARDGDVVEVEAGDYVGDVARWTQKRLTIRGVGGRARLIAGRNYAEGKGIWVIRGQEYLVENMTFVGSRVPHYIGAGIRFETGKLTVRNCSFVDNEIGILTNNEPDQELVVEDSEFGPNGNNVTTNHNLYAGRIASLKVTGSYFHHGKIGHLLKSRAAYNWIAYNRLTDENGGSASYELEFPEGGIAIVLGNLIEQTETTQNPKMVSFGAEAFRGATHQLFLINNTLVDDKPHNGRYVFVNEGGHTQVTAINNLFLGAPPLELPDGAVSLSNHQAKRSDFVDPSRFDYRLSRQSPLRGQAVMPGQHKGLSLKPVAEYEAVAKARKVDVKVLNPGGMQSTGP